MSEFCEKKGIKKEFCIAKTPQQNGVAERRNRTLIEDARTIGRTPVLSFMRPFRCHVTILNTLDYLGKFDGKSDEGFFVGYSLNSKAFRVYNIRTRKVKENLNIRFLEDKPIISGDVPKWLFDIDVLTKSMNYVPVVAGTNSNDLVVHYSSLKNASNDEPQPSSNAEKKDDEGVNKESGIDDQERPKNSTQDVHIAGPSINTASTNVNTGSLNINTISPIVTTDLLEVTHDDFFSSVQQRRMTKTTNEQGFISAVYEVKIHKDLHTCLFACFLSQEEPKNVIQALKDPSWIEAMQEEILQFKLQQVWTLVNLPHGKRAIGTKWVYMNKKDERVARIEAIRLFLAYASFKDFVVYQMDVKSAFLYGKIEVEVYVCQPLGFKDPEFPNRVYKVEKALYGLHQAPRAWYETLSTYLLDNGFQRASTPMETSKPLMKDENFEDVDVHLYRSMIGSLMYLTSLRPDIIFAVCACARFQVTPKVSHLHTVKRIFRYLKGQPKLGLWYPKDSPFDLEAYTDSDYAGASLDRKSTTRANDEIQVSAIGLTYYTLDNGEIELTATIDDKVKIVIEASIRRHFQLANSDGISSLPTTKIFEQLSLMGNIKRASKGYTGENIPLFPAMIGQGLESMVPQPKSPTQTPIADEAASICMDVRYGGATTTITGLEVGQCMTLQELMVLCTTLSKKVESLEIDLKQTKLTYCATYTKLIKKVKKLENKVKSSQARRRARIIGRHEHDMEFDFDLDAAKDVKTVEKDVSTTKPVSTAGVAVTTASVVVSTAKDKAVRLQTELEEEERQRIARVHKVASSFNVEEWEDIQARVEDDAELAQRLQAEEREMYTKAKQARMRGYTLQQLRGYSFDEIKNLFETTMRRVHTFVPIESEIERVIHELAAGISKRDAEEELDQESSKRQKIGESSEPAEEPRDK
ncbi:putative ribonuclease H-like domain-containing protein [Tanacetum coccineum]|uniref:Ribonuclease H-like domain-containing protein n=1 Tax=Tanacetum coccineum TaxID=301880 RepID=A0ABQ5HPV9_9ASTR